MSTDNHRKETAALASIGASALITVAKLVAGLLSGSLALLSEAGHALLDTGATIITYFAVRAAGKPADEEHHYGHGKIEAVAALAETGLLAVLAFVVALEAARRLIGNIVEPIAAGWLAFGVLGMSICIDLVRWRALSKISRETRSDALAADALHFSSDLFASIAVVAGLLATRLGYPQGDGVAAIVVSVFIATASYRLGRRTIDTLVDAAPQGLAERVRMAAASVAGVVGVESVRLRPAGAEVFGEICINVARTLPLERVARVSEAVAAAIRHEAVEVTPTITANPVALDNESALERVLLISARRRVAVHHVTIQDVAGKRSVSLDLEIDGVMALGAAHDIASGLEVAIQQELGDDVEVETHIEPMQASELSGEDANPATVNDMIAVLSQAAGAGPLSNVHDVRARSTANGFVVNYHCRAPMQMSVEAVHSAVDELDRKLRLAFPEVTRVVGHAEPSRG